MDYLANNKHHDHGQGEVTRDLGRRWELDSTRALENELNKFMHGVR